MALKPIFESSEPDFSSRTSERHKHSMESPRPHKIVHPEQPRMQPRSNGPPVVAFDVGDVDVDLITEVEETYKACRERIWSSSSTRDRAEGKAWLDIIELRLRCLSEFRSEGKALTEECRKKKRSVV